jgi:preprotein translocase subunit SecD
MLNAVGGGDVHGMWVDSQVVDEEIPEQKETGRRRPSEIEREETEVRSPILRSNAKTTG